MPTVEAWSLWLHIAAGVVAVLAGVGALVTRKGGRRHRQAGKLFLGSMAVVVGTVFVLVALDFNTFRLILTLIAIFSGYLAFSGYRAVSRKRSATSSLVVDWVAAVAVVLACGALGVWGLVWMFEGNSFGVVMSVFAGIGIVFGGVDMRTLHTDSHEAPILTHLQRMCGAFIAVISAVSAVNLTATLGILAWLWPTILGVPLIAYYTTTYRST